MYAELSPSRTSIKRTTNFTGRDVRRHGTGESFALPVQGSNPALSPEGMTRINELLVQAVNSSIIHFYVFNPDNLEGRDKSISINPIDLMIHVMYQYTSSLVTLE